MSDTQVVPAPVCTALRWVGGSLQVRLLRGAQFSKARPSKNFLTSSPKAACTRAGPRLHCLGALFPRQREVPFAASIVTLSQGRNKEGPDLGPPIVRKPGL